MKTMHIVLAALATATIGTAASASAESRWDREHPRQHQVLRRAHHQIKRIDAERRAGLISEDEARALRARDHAIAYQERAEARANGGYLTRGEQKQLNREEHAQARAIRGG